MPSLKVNFQVSLQVSIRIERKTSKSSFSSSVPTHMKDNKPVDYRTHMEIRNDKKLFSLTDYFPSQT